VHREKLAANIRTNRWYGRLVCDSAFAMLQLAAEQASEPVTPLTQQERIRLSQLEREVETNLTGFLKCGMALKEIHEPRLWRSAYQSFSEYAKLRFGLCHSTANQLVRSTTVYETLVQSTGAPDSDTPIAETVPEIVLRPLTTIPHPELQAQTWRLTASVSPDKKPTRTIAARVARMVKDAIDGDSKKNGHAKYPEPMFVRPIQRLAKIDTFRADLAVAHVDSTVQATRIVTACRIVAARCREIEARLTMKFAA
jgi:hypothetical protein